MLRCDSDDPPHIHVSCYGHKIQGVSELLPCSGIMLVVTPVMRGEISSKPKINPDAFNKRS